MSNSVIRDIKQSIADLLLADPYFANIPVLVKIPKDILNEINQGTLPLGSGMAFFIGSGSLRNVGLNGPGPLFDDGSFVVEALQNPTLTPTNETFDVDEAGEMAMRLIHMQPLGGDNAFAVDEWAEAEDDIYSRRMFKVKGLVGFSVVSTQPQLAPVTISPTTAGNQTVTLACATAGAAIFYTLDGTYPSPRGGTLYTAPITVAAGQQLRARAWLAGFAPPNPPDVSNQY